MEKNILKEISDKKLKFKEIVQKVHNFEWISKEESNDIYRNLENDKLTIGVIGQMKCGKSTFLNAFLFGDVILPAATTPMTASLSIVTYGDKKEIEAEFYTKEEWEGLKLQANRRLEDAAGNLDLEGKIKAAKEIVGKALSIQSEISSLLNTRKKDHFESLIEYVGADGKYIAITKSVTIYMPIDYLKGVEIVDTPGFNDPVVSREERTKDFLKKADAVIMLLYAGRAFDSTDKDIIFNKLRSIGIGKILIGVNKYDLPYSNGETISEILENVKKQLKTASLEYLGNSISELVLEKDPLLLSANMALMAKLPLQKVLDINHGFKFYYEKALDDFEITSQEQMLEKSLFYEFEHSLKDVIFNSKEEILLKKPRNFILQKSQNKLEKLLNEVNEVQNKKKVLETPDHELDSLLSKTKKIKRKVDKKIEGFIYDVNEKIKLTEKYIIRGIDDILDTHLRKIEDSINDQFFVFNSKNQQEKIERSFGDLKKNLDRFFDSKRDSYNNDIRKILKNLIFEFEEIFESHEDFETDFYLKKIKNWLLNDPIEFDYFDLLPDNDSIDPEDSFLLDALEFLNGFVLGATFGLFHKSLDGVTNLISGKSDLKDEVREIFSLYRIDLILKKIDDGEKFLIKDVTNLMKEEFLNPIIKEIEEIIENTSNKEDELELVKNREIEITNSVYELEKQIQEINMLM